MKSELTIEKANELLLKLNQLQQRFFFINKHKAKDITEASLLPMLKEICHEVAELLSVQQVQIWSFNEKQTAIYTVCDYNLKDPNNSQTLRFEKMEMPLYFEAIFDQRTYAINDVDNIELTDDLQTYFNRLNFNAKAMLDAVITSYSGPGGVICCLTDYKVEWTLIHRHVLSSVADMLAFVFERIQQVRSEDYIYNLAYKDIVTGLYNQNGFLHIVQAGFANDLFTEGSFICFKIDQFKDIQSVLGYHAAETLLQKVAQKILSFNMKDTVIARLAFDYFIAFTPLKNKDIFKDGITDEIIEKLESPIRIENQEVYVTFSYGISSYPEHALNVLAGIQTAQMALESGLKKKSRRANKLYQIEIKEDQEDIFMSEISLRKGLELNEFVLYYQPKVANGTNKLTGFEALIRWQHPEKGLLTPEQFIPLAESTGLINEIGEFVILQACQQLGDWHQKERDDITVSINLSPNHFLANDLPEFLLQTIEKYQINANKLIIEITENIVVEDIENVIKRIQTLQKLGFIISIDDFGTGYSSFKYLQNYPVQQIKIDRQFIKGIEDDYRSFEIVKSMVFLNKALGIEVVAEGVETAGQYQRLNILNCDEIQGYYFSKPLSAYQAEQYLQTN